VPPDDARKRSGKASPAVAVSRRSSIMRFSLYRAESQRFDDGKSPLADAAKCVRPSTYAVDREASIVKGAGGRRVAR
jgi:ABC-type ATPase with predicted acetyltransferase domain